MGGLEKRAYEIWAYRVGSLKAWEHLTDVEQMAWREVIELLEPELPEFDELGVCDDCGTELACPVCDVEKFAVVAATAGKPTAVLTKKV